MIPCQHSSRAAAPFQCEFCDIIVLYGQSLEQKPSPAVAELDYLLRVGVATRCFMVDDNFIGNKRNGLLAAKRAKGANSVLPLLILKPLLTSRPEN